MLRLCFNCLSALGLMLCVDEVLRRNVRENQPQDLSNEFDESTY